MREFLAELPFLVQALLALACVLVLVAAIFFIARLFTRNSVSKAANRTRQPRLGVIDVASVDGRRQLIIVRRDAVEHLLMIGGPNDVVIESNIVRAQPAGQTRDDRSVATDSEAANPSPRPAREMPSRSEPREPPQPAAAKPVARSDPGMTQAPFEVRPRSADLRAFAPPTRTAPPLVAVAPKETPVESAPSHAAAASMPTVSLAPPSSAGAKPELVAAKVEPQMPVPKQAPVAAPVPAPMISSNVAAPAVVSAAKPSTDSPPSPAPTLKPPVTGQAAPSPTTTPMAVPGPEPAIPAASKSPIDLATDLEAEMASILGRLSAPPRQ